jgi:ATP-dependent RNA helicase MSS116
LAEQIAVEAKKLTRGTRIVVQTATGGSQKNVAMKKMRQEGCHVLVATPGRLKDILTDEYSKVSAPNLSAFVLDEADRLLDQGFVPEIRAIEALMPDRRQVDRQTLMFSATVPREVMSLVNSFMKKDYSFVQTVQKGEVQTHERVPQKLVRVTGLENFMPALLELAKNELVKTDSELPFKAIVYFNASSEATLAHKIFSNLTNPGDTRFGGHPFQSTTLIEMHARLSQNVRSKNAEIFRRSKTAIMFSSDVTARGMDFPNVTHVIQIGVPGTKDTYVHRIGRTARGDKNGEGWLLVSSLEYHETLQRLDDIPLVEDNSLATATIDMKKDAQLPASVAQTLTQIVEATKTVDFATKRAAYKASLGVYAWVSPRQKIVQFMNDRSMYGWGMAQPPGIPVALAKRLGFRTDSGLNLIKSEESRGGGVGESSGGGRGSRSFNFWEGGVRGGRASDFRDGEDRGGRSFGSRDGGDRAPRRSFGGDRPERPSYGSGERRTGSFDRKETRNGYEDRPRRPSGAQGRSSFGGERKSYGAREGGFERGGDRAPRAERSVAKEAY